jgi:hypothetical protein
MKIGDIVQIEVKIQPHCSCVYGPCRGDEITSCEAHGIKGCRKPSVVKTLNGIVKQFFNIAGLPMVIVIIDNEPITFYADTGIVFNASREVFLAYKNLESIKLICGEVI